MKINAYLVFSGQCEEAFQLYAKVLGGKIEAMIRHEGTPAESQVPAEWRSKIMHAYLTVNGESIMGSDAPPAHATKPAGFSVSVTVTDPNEAERIYRGLVEGGTERMPIQQTFWSPKFGMLVDRFGIPWMINTAPATA